MVIVVEGLEKSFNGKKVLKGISFKVRKGEIFGYLGPNGAGKTTTVRILTGILKPDKGNVYVCGYDVAENPLKVKERIGVLPEVANVYPDLTAWQNVMLASQLYGIDKRVAERKCEKLLREFGIDDRRNVKTRFFSKGMKQRLMLCMALISDPEVIFLDEPTSGLDVLSARLLRMKILELSDMGVTIFLTTHNMDEAEMLCDEIAIIKDGRIVKIGTPDDIRGLVGEEWIVEVSFNENVDFEGERVEDRFILRSNDLNEVLMKISDFVRGKGVRVTYLNVRKPTLEEAFLKITGEEL